MANLPDINPLVERSVGKLSEGVHRQTRGRKEPFEK